MNNIHKFQKYILSLVCLLIALSINQKNLHAQCAANYSEVCVNSAGPYNFTNFDVDGSSCLANVGNTAGYIVMNIATTGLLSLNVNGNATSGFIDVAVFNIPAGVAPCVAAGNGANQISCNFASSSSGCASFNDPSCASNQVNTGLNLNAGDRIIIIAEDYSSAANNFTVTLSGAAGTATAGPPIVDIEDDTVLNCDAPAIVAQGPNNSAGGVYTASCGACIDATTGIFDPAGLEGTYTITYTQYTPGNDCFSDDMSTITVQGAAPTITCPANVAVSSSVGLCSGTATWTIPTPGGCPSTLSSTHNPGDVFPIGTTSVTYTAMNADGTAMCTFNVSVADDEAPECLTQNSVIQLDDAGDANIVAGDVDNGSNDACGIASLSVAPNTFTCANVGDNTVTLTVTDNNTNVSTCDATVTIEDNVMPECLTQNIVIQLDDAGDASIVAGDVDNGSNDACGIASLAVASNAFTCANIGENTVTLTVTDNNTNVSTCDATVTVEDNVMPECLTQNIVIQLDDAGDASIVAGDVDNGSNDACGVASLSIAPSAFTCANVGDNTVTLTVTDNNTNVSTCDATVTVEDNVMPECLTQNIVIQLDDAGDASIVAGDVDNGSNDACGIASLSVAPNTFTCANVGENTVTLTVTDSNTNVSTCDATVTIEDNVMPECLTQNIIVQLDDTGAASIVAGNVDNGSNDACGIASLSVAPNTFICANVGDNTVTLTVTDNNTNVSTCDATVTVEDNVAPECLTQNIVIQLDDAGDASIVAGDIDNGSNDACGIASLSVAPNTFTCANVGDNTVTLTVTDNNTNVSNCDATVTVEDNVAPECLTQNIVVQLDDAGDASIVAGDVDNGSNDACGIASLSVAPNAFTCANVGDNTVTLTVTDNNTNVSTCDATVTVEDNVAPDCQTQDIEVFLDENGEVSIVPADVDNGSSDACGIATMSLNIMDFDCSDLGANTVILSLTDINDNSSNCNAEVTVTDAIPAVISCRQPISTCAAPGQCGNDIITLPPFATDNCEIIDISRDGPDSFFPVGTTVLTWSVTDSGNNVTTCNQNVIIIDEEAPTVSSCSTETAFDYDTDCMAQVTVDVQGTDNCGIASVVGNGTFNFPLGVQVIHPVTFTDVNGLVTVHNVIISVHDEHAPFAEDCPESITAQQGSSIPNLVPTFTDNCEIYELSNDAPDEFPLGTTTVTYTAFDYYGNRGECTFDVIITEQNIFMGATAEHIEACVEEEELSADVRWNTPNVSTVCDYCPTTEYENYFFVGEFYGHQYFLYRGEEQLTQAEAIEAATENLNGHLVTINDSQENTYLSRQIPFGTAPISTGLNVSIVENEEEETVVYNWTNADAFDYNNLVITEDSEIEAGQIIAFNADGTWALLPADAQTTFLIERPCVDLRQTGPYVQFENEDEEIETVLLKSGDLFPRGEYTVTYEAENLCGDIFTHTFDVVVDEPQAAICTTGGGDEAIFIESVSIGNLTNTLAEDEEQTGYRDYSETPIDLNTVFTLEEGELAPLSIPVNLTAGGAAANETVYWSVWADLNRDGDFFDANELILQESDNQAIVSQLPLDLFGEDAIAVRASVSRYAYPEVCADYFSGETEDYSFVLPARVEEVGFRNDDTEGQGNLVALTDENTKLSPNPASVYTIISTPVLTTESTLRLMSTDGKLLSQSTLAGLSRQHRLDVSDLSEGLYFVEIINGESLIRKKIMVVK